MNDRLDLQFGRGRGGIFRAGPRPRRPLQAIVMMMKPWPGAKTELPSTWKRLAVGRATWVRILQVLKLSAAPCSDPAESVHSHARF